MDHLSTGALVALLMLVTLVLLAALGRLRFIANEFPNRIRAVIASVLLLAVLALCVFYPAVSPDDAKHINPETIRLPDLFLGHAFLTAFLIAWWRIRS